VSQRDREIAAIEAAGRFLVFGGSKVGQAFGALILACLASWLLGGWPLAVMLVFHFTGLMDEWTWGWFAIAQLTAAGLMAFAFTQTGSERCIRQQNRLERERQGP